jgi:WD40 repeat protein
VSTTTPEHPNPYVGPRPFGADDKPYFFGRDRETQELADLVVAERVVLLHSPSGAGKTSLLQAALLPRLSRRFQVLPAVRVSLVPPAGGTAVTNRYVWSVLQALEAGVPAEQRLPAEELGRLNLDEYLFRRTERERPAVSVGPAPAAAPSEPVAHPRPVLLVFDQFEEILTRAPNDREGKEAFFAQLAPVLRRDRRRAGEPEGTRPQPLWVLFAMREDHVGPLKPYRQRLPTGLSATYRLDLLGEEAALQAVQGPARAAGRPFTDTAARKLVENLRRVRVQVPGGRVETQIGPNVEPVQLQVVCRRLWQRLPPDRQEIGDTDVEQLADVDNALADYYAEWVAAIARTTPVREKRLRSWFGKELIVDPGIRVPVLRYGPTDALPNETVEELLRSFLVREEQRPNASFLELSHDRLIEPVRRNNNEWTTRRRDHRAKAVAVAAVALLAAALAGWGWSILQRRQAVKLEDQLAEVKRNAAETHSNLQGQLLGAQDKAESERVAAAQRAQAGQLAAKALVYSSTQPDLAALLALEAVAHQPKDQAGTLPLSSLLNVLQANPQLESFLRVHEVEVTAVAFSPDGQLLASADAAGGIVWSRFPTGEKAFYFPRPHGDQRVTAVAFSPDHKRFASADVQGRVVLWSVADHRPGAPLPGDSNRPIVSMTFVPDGNTLAAADEAGRVWLWDLAAASPGMPRTLSAAEPVTGLAVSPAREAAGFALGLKGGRIQLGNWRTGELRAPVASGRGTVSALAFSRSGKWLAAGVERPTAQGPGDAHVVRLWDVSGPAPRALGRPLRGHLAEVRALAFSPAEEGVLVSGGVDKALIRWALPADLGTQGAPAGAVYGPDQRAPAAPIIDSNGPVGQLLTGHQGPVTGVAFHPMGGFLASGSADSTVALWDLNRTERLRGARLDWPPPADVYEPPRQLDTPWGCTAVNPKADRLAVSFGATVDLFDLAQGRSLSPPLRGHQGPVRGLAFAPDNWTLATASEDGTVILWDTLGMRQLVAPLTGHTGPVNRVAFRPTDGAWLSSGGADGTVILWDRATLQPIGAPVKGPGGGIAGLDFDRKGEGLAVQTRDGTAVRLDVDPASWQRQARRLANRNLTPEEWRTFFGDGEVYQCVIPELAQPDEPKVLRGGPGLLVAKRWPAGQVLGVYFLEGDPDLRRRVMQTAREWSTYANVRFEFGADAQAPVRVAFRPSGFLSLMGTEARGIPSSVATINLDGNQLRSGGDALLTQQTLRVFGHTLGLINEHQKPYANIPWNRPKVYQHYVGTLGWTAQQVDQLLFQTFQPSEVALYPYFDRQSIMVVPISKELTLGGFEASGNPTLSDPDKEAIAVAYPFDKEAPELTPGPSQPVANAPGQVGRLRFNVPARGRAVLDVSNREGEAELSLFGPGNETHSVTGDERGMPVWAPRVERVLEPGVYYVKVRQRDATARGQSTLRLAVE